ncbi:exodeoxyribonuclease VII large subunit [Nitrospinaceae bacterium]|nr:exodeoxyribonuclease VII large subunit [Nitrospinaceae bacterium]
MQQEETTPQIYSVSEITNGVKATLEFAFDSVWIQGEISNLRIPGSKHAYFVLKDDRSQIRCVLFKGSQVGLEVQPEDGKEVKLSGHVTVYEARGDYQVVVKRIESIGEGKLQEKFEKLRDRLNQEGLFGEERKKTIPQFPWRVGVVTSATGAAIRDIINIIQRRNPKVSVLVYPVKVQGEGSAEEITEAIQQMNKISDLDVLIVGRGGGSIEDLWAFNEEIVARAISKSTLPVVSAVGHEIDFTIADFVADLRAPTPSAAAELVVPMLEEKNRNLNMMAEQLLVVLHNRVQKYEDLLKRLMGRRFFKDPMYIMQPQVQRLDDLNNRLFRGLGQWILVQGQKFSGMIHQLVHLTPAKNIRQLGEKKALFHHLLVQNIHSRIRFDRERFDGVLKNLNALSPLSILDRGYSIANFQGKALTQSDRIMEGDSIKIRLAKGQLMCTVDEVIPSQEKQ